MTYPLADGIANVITGLGTGSDPSTYNQYVLNGMSQFQIEASYRSSPWSRKVHDIIPGEMTRTTRDWKADGTDIETLENEEKRLAVWHKAYRALLLARAYGGSLIVMGVDGQGDPWEPLVVDKVRAGQLRYLHTMSRHQVSIVEMDQDVRSDFFGQPKLYMIGNSAVHPSRVVSFVGQPLLEGSAWGASDHWGDPLLMSLMTTLVNADVSQASVAALLSALKVDTLSIPNLGSRLTTKEYEGQLMARVRMAKLFESMFNVKMIDAGDGSEGNGEKWETRQIATTGLPDITTAFLQFVAGAADIPMTRLAGISPGGLNSTGKGEERDFERMIDDRRERELRPALDRLDAVLVRSALGTYPTDLWWDFGALSTIDPTEAATVEKTHADAYTAYMNAGGIDPDVLSEAAVNGIIERGTAFPGLVYKAAPDVEPDPLDGMDPAMLADPAAFGDAAPRTLYVSRPVVNRAELATWAKAQGLPELQDDLHVTLAYSRTPVDWMKIEGEWNQDAKGEITITPGGVRIVEPLGDRTAVLLFTSSALSWRHESIIRAGASHDYPDYQPHISLTAEPVDLANVEPYRGKIVLGPERFEELQP